MADVQQTGVQQAQGKIVQCIGAVVDVEFPRDQMPKVYDALKMEGGELTLEVQQQLGDGVGVGTPADHRTVAIVAASSGVTGCGALPSAGTPSSWVTASMSTG